MNYGIRNCVGVGGVVGIPRFSVSTSSNTSWLSIPVCFSSKDNEDSIFEVKIKATAAEVLNGKIKLGDTLLVDGILGKGVNDLKECDAGGFVIYADKTMITKSFKQRFIKATIFGKITNEPKHIPISGKNEKFFAGAVRVPFTFKKDNETKWDNVFFDLVAFGVTGEKAYSKLMRDEEAYIEGRPSRKKDSSGKWSLSIIFNFFRET